jgi:hypothetical protein
MRTAAQVATAVRIGFAEGPSHKLTWHRAMLVLCKESSPREAAACPLQKSGTTPRAPRHRAHSTAER